MSLISPLPYTITNYNIMSMRCETMENELLKLRLELAASKSEIVNLKAGMKNGLLDLGPELADSRSETKAELREKTEENEGLRFDLEGLEGFAKVKRHEHKVLQQKYEDLVETSAQAQREEAATIFELELKIEELQRNSDAKIRELEARVAEVESFGPCAESRIPALEAKIKELESDRDQNRMLFDVGVDIRVRFLQNAKKQLGLRYEQNSDAIRKGNIAAHAGIGEADVILFQPCLLPNDLRVDLWHIFVNLYGTHPLEYGSRPRKLLEAFDCEATLRTVIVINKGLRPLREREQALGHIEIIKEKYQKLTRQQFEADEDVDRRLAQVKLLTDEIVEEDRLRRSEIGKRPQGNNKRST
jgi:hypothetical protein